MKLYSGLVLLFGIVAQVRGTRITLDEGAVALCKKYKMMCKTGKVCAVQHFDWPNNITIPVCIPLSFVPVRHQYCQLTPDKGRCHARYIRWYFNVETQECTHFQYGGCGGNQNNFMERKDCEQTCMATPAIRLYDSGQSALVQPPSVISAPVYQPPGRQQYEALNSIVDQAPSSSYDRYAVSRHHRINRVRADDANNSRTRRRRDKEKKEKERKRKDRERKRERKRLRRLRKKELKKQKKRDQRLREKKDKKKKDDDDSAAVNDVLQGDEADVVKRDNKNKDVKEVVKQTKEMVTNGIGSERDRLRKERRRERKRLKQKRRERRRQKERKRLEKEAKRHAENNDNEDSKNEHEELLQKPNADIAAQMFAKLDHGSDKTSDSATEST